MSIFHDHTMVLQHMNADGTMFYRCACGATLTAGWTTTTSTSPFPGPYVTTGTIKLNGNAQPKPAHQPVPDAFYKAFEDEEVDPGVIAFDCMCGTPLTIKKYSPESTISGTFCQVCGEQHWTRWSDGIVRHGGIEG